MAYLILIVAVLVIVILIFIAAANDAKKPDYATGSVVDEMNQDEGFLAFEESLNNMAEMIVSNAATQYFKWKKKGVDDDGVIALGIFRLRFMNSESVSTLDLVQIVNLKSYFDSDYNIILSFSNMMDFCLASLDIEFDLNLFDTPPQIYMPVCEKISQGLSKAGIEVNSDDVPDFVSKIRSIMENRCD